MNPVRAGMVKHPGEYRWSSYQVNGQEIRSDLITHHSLYLGLGEMEAKRQDAYRDLFRCEFEAGEIDKVRKAINGNFALSNRIDR